MQKGLLIHSTQFSFVRISGKCTGCWCNCQSCCAFHNLASVQPCQNWYISIAFFDIRTTNILDLKSTLEITATSNFCCHNDATDIWCLICLSCKNKYNVCRRLAHLYVNIYCWIKYILNNNLRIINYKIKIFLRETRK